MFKDKQLIFFIIFTFFIGITAYAAGPSLEEKMKREIEYQEDLKVTYNKEAIDLRRERDKLNARLTEAEAKVISLTDSIDLHQERIDDLSDQFRDSEKIVETTRAWLGLRLEQ